MASSKKLKLDVRSFQEFWTTDFGFISRYNQAGCALCCQNVVYTRLKYTRMFKLEKCCNVVCDYDNIRPVCPMVHLPLVTNSILTPVYHINISHPMKCLPQGHDKQIFRLFLQTISFMLSAKQRSRKYHF